MNPNDPELQEYLRRNMQVARLGGARERALNIIKHAESLNSPPPKWLMESVQSIYDALNAGVVKDMVAYRQQVSPYPSERKPDPFQKD